MIVVIINAPMCAKSVAAWNMIVLASSIDRAVHVGRSIGCLFVVREDSGPRSEHIGSAACSHIVLKSPKPMAAMSRCALSQCVRLVTGM